MKKISYIKDQFSTNDVGIMANKKRCSYDDLFFNQYGENEYKENYAGYLIYTLSCALMRCMHALPSELDLNISNQNEHISSSVDLDDVKGNIEKMAKVIRLLCDGKTISEDYYCTCLVANLPSLPDRLNATVLNIIRNMFLAYGTDKQMFFDLVATNVPFILRYFDGEYMSGDTTEPHTVWRDVFDNKDITNIPAYYHAKSIEFLLFLDSIKKITPKKSLCGSGMFGFNPSEDEDGIFPSRERLQRKIKEIYVNMTVPDDSFHECLKSMEADHFERVYLKDVSADSDFAKYVANHACEDGLKLHMKYSVLYVVNEYHFPETYIADHGYNILQITNNMPRVVNSILDASVTEDTMNEIASRLAAKTALAESAEAQKLAVKEKTSLKKELKSKKQEISNLQGKCVSLQAKLDHLESQKKTEKNDDFVKELQIKVEASEREKQKLSEELSESKAKVTELTTTLTKLSKDHKALNAKIYELHMAGKDLEQEMPEQEKSAELNKYSFLIVGGVNNLGKMLKQRGFTSFDLVEDTRRIVKGGNNYDFVVICTKFCSHSLQSAAFSRYSRDKIFYFNQANCTSLLSEIYNYVQDKKNTTNSEEE